MAILDTRQGESRMLRLVSAAHQAGLRPRGWQDCLHEMRQMFGLPYAAHMVRTDDFSRLSGTASGASQAEYDDMLGTYFTGSVYLRSPFPVFTGQIAASREMASKRDVLASAIYQGWNRDRDVHEMLRLVMQSEGGVTKLITLGRPWHAGPFDAEDMRVCRALMPHLQAAVVTADRMQGADLYARTALAGLDLLRHSVLLLDAAARVFHSNSAADAFLARSTALQLSRGVLRAASPAQTERLHAAFGAALGRDGRVRAQHLRLPRPDGPPLIVLVVPVSGEAEWAVLHRPALLLCITDPAAGTAVPPAQLTELFGLTPAEAALAGDLLAGLDLRDVAERQRRSINTVRTHLARLMAKTEVNKQSHLLRLLSTLPGPH